MLGLFGGFRRLLDTLRFVRRLHKPAFKTAHTFLQGLFTVRANRTLRAVFALRNERLGIARQRVRRA